MSGFTPHDVCTWAGRQTVGGSKNKAVLNALALFADRMTWECWPSFALISQYTEIPERSVSRAVAELEKNKFISRERIRRRDGSLAGWRFKLNPQGLEVVVPPPPMSAAEAEAASEAADQPQANLACGDQDVGERAGNDPQDAQNSHPPTAPGGETTTVVVLDSPAANGGGSIGTTTENITPLPPNSPAAAPLAETASGGRSIENQQPPPTDPARIEAERFRALCIAEFGSAVFGAWFDDLTILETIRDDSTPPTIRVRLGTGSPARADRLNLQHSRRLEEIWRVISGAGPDVRIRVAVKVAPDLAEALARQRAEIEARGEGVGNERHRRRRRA